MAYGEDDSDTEGAAGSCCDARLTPAPSGYDVQGAPPSGYDMRGAPPSAYADGAGLYGASTPKEVLYDLGASGDPPRAVAAPVLYDMATVRCPRCCDVQDRVPPASPPKEPAAAKVGGAAAAKPAPPGKGPAPAVGAAPAADTKRDTPAASPPRPLQAASEASTASALLAFSLSNDTSDTANKARKANHELGERAASDMLQARAQCGR